MTASSARARPQAALALIALAALLTACEQRLPTASEIEAMDAVQADRLAGVAGDPGQPTRFFLDGVAVDRERARRVPREQIDRIEIIRSETPAIHIFTKDAPSASAHPGAEPPTRSGADEPLLLIDGRVRDRAALKSLDADDIESVEVVKGEAARRLYPDHPRAANGVILVTTKR